MIKRFLVFLFGDGSNPSPIGEEKIKLFAMRSYRLGAHTKTDLNVPLVWIPKYRKKVLPGAIAVCTPDILHQIAYEYDFIPPGMGGRFFIASNVRETFLFTIHPNAFR